MRVLLLGATGLAGGAILHALLRGGHEVIAAARRLPPHLPPHLASLPAGELRWAFADLDAPPPALTRLAAGCDALVCAAISPLDPHLTLERAARHAQHLAAAARDARVHRLLLLSCASTAGRLEDRPVQERDLLLPGASSSARVNAMLAVEGEVLAANSNHLYATALLATVPFGPLDPRPPHRALLPALRALPPDQRPPDLRANLIEVREIARSVHAALQQGRPGQRYLLGGRVASLAGLFPEPPPPGVAASLAPLQHLTAIPENIDKTKSRVELGHASPKLGAALQEAAASLCSQSITR